MTDKGNILTIGDTLGTLTAMLTAEGYRVYEADSGDAALAFFAAGPPELILLEIRTPEKEGFDVYRHIRLQEKNRHIPTIFISESADAETVLKGLRLGAVDFMSRPFRREELLARVQIHLELSRSFARWEQRVADLQLANERLRSEIDELRRREEEIKETSLRDELTGLYNRRGFITLAEQQLKGARRAQRQLMLTFIDFDDLKGINDALGHEEGDKALTATALILRQTFRESDIIARIGGDEFAVLAIDSTDLSPEAFAQRLGKNITSSAAKGRRFRLALSWGAVIYDHQSPLSLDQLMSAADRLMYAQKKNKPGGEDKGGAESSEFTISIGEAVVRQAPMSKR